jgi:broad specificity phosphatase PhoE
LEFTRLRPGVYAGDTTYSTQLLVEIVSNAIDEFRLGHGNKIEVKINKNIVSVRDYGQGFIPNSVREDGKTILIGSHSSVIRALQCYIQGLPLEKMKNTPRVVNASLAEIDFDGENFYIFKYGFDGHLSDL